jgi:glycerol-3-phosphate dehydrogenase subunit B
MIKQARRYQSELAVIGAGLAGCAATMFALNRGIKTTQIGNTGALAYTSGYFDLLGVGQGEVLRDPWQGLAQLRQHEPQHPYAKIEDTEIKQAFDEFVLALAQMGLNYTIGGECNLLAMLPVGSFKPTYCMPGTMSLSTQAMSSESRVLIIDFAGLQGFSAAEIVANLKSQWPHLTARRIVFPEMEDTGQVYAEVMARALEVPATCEKLAATIKPLLGDAEYVALPAILGIHKSDQVHQTMQRLLGLPIFEIPTIPPAVAGIRLRELLEQQLAARGATVITQNKVEKVSFNEDSIQLSLNDNYGPVIIEAQKLVLASGRFLSGGLKADQYQIRESLMDLPVLQPESRENWFDENYFAAAGHQVNRVGLEVNEHFQVLGQQGEVIDQRLYAAGIVLAGQDWIRQRCGAGIAISSAFKVIESIRE